QNSRLEVHVDALRLVVVPGGGVGDLRGGKVELRLAQLYDGSEAQVVSALGKVHGKLRLLEQLLRERHAVMGRGGVQVGNADIADDAVLLIVDVCAGGLGLEFGFGLAGLEEAAIENGDGNIHADGAVAAGYLRLGGGGKAGGAQHAYGGKIQGMLS